MHIYNGLRLSDFKYCSVCVRQTYGHVTIVEKNEQAFHNTAVANEVIRSVWGRQLLQPNLGLFSMP